MSATGTGEKDGGGNIHDRKQNTQLQKSYAARTNLQSADESVRLGWLVANHLGFGIVPHVGFSFMLTNNRTVRVCFAIVSPSRVG